MPNCQLGAELASLAHYLYEDLIERFLNPAAVKAQRTIFNVGSVGSTKISPSMPSRSRRLDFAIVYRTLHFVAGSSDSLSGPKSC